MTYTFGSYQYNAACVCDWCANDGRNPNPLMVSQGGSYGYAEPHNPPGSQAPWANQDTPMTTRRDTLLRLAANRRKRLDARAQGRPMFDLTREEIEASVRTAMRLAHAERLR